MLSVRRKIINLAGLTVLVLAAPTAASAVSVSSNDGSGHQSLTSKYNNGWAASGKLKSTTGNKVYYAGNVIYNSYPDYDCGRYSTNTTSLSLVTRGGSCSQFPPPPGPSADAAKYKVCRDRTGLPDGCGSWSGRDSF